MPTLINILQGNTALFTVEFLDANGNLIVPSSATLSVVYTAVGGSTASSSIAMAQIGSFFTASWSSTGAAMGSALWSVNAPGQTTTPAQSGTIRVIDP